MNKLYKRIVLLVISLFFITTNVYAYTDTAKSTVVIDNESKRILYEKNKDEQRLIASITKIMTAVIAIENKNLDDVVTIGNEILPMYGSNIYIEVGEKISLRDLLYGLILRSGNDAAVAIATFVGGTESKFVEMMNKKAQEIGMKNTIFNNSHGLDDEENRNYSTAYDMAVLSAYANTLMEYCEISNTKNWKTSTNEKTYLWNNRNKLLNNYKYATGGKTGYTPKAGKTLVTTANKNKLNLTIVTLNDNNMYNTHESLYEYIFNKYEKVLLIDKNDFDIEDSFYKGTIYIKKSFSYPLTEKEQKLTQVVVNLFKIKKYKNDDKVGEIIVKLNEKEIYKDSIYIKVKEEKKTGIWEKILIFFKKILNI